MVVDLVSVDDCVMVGVVVEDDNVVNSTVAVRATSCDVVTLESEDVVFVDGEDIVAIDSEEVVAIDDEDDVAVDGECVSTGQGST